MSGEVMETASVQKAERASTVYVGAEILGSSLSDLGEMIDRLVSFRQDLEAKLSPVLSGDDQVFPSFIVEEVSADQRSPLAGSFMGAAQTVKALHTRLDEELARFWALHRRIDL